MHLTTTTFMPITQSWLDITDWRNNIGLDRDLCTSFKRNVTAHLNQCAYFLEVSVPISAEVTLLP
jgi:hypothetical protein